MLGEVEQQTAIGAIAAAAFDPRAWPGALEWLERVGHGWCTQILGISSAGLQFNLGHRIPEELNDEFVRRGGTDAAVNLRMRVYGHRAYALLQDRDLATTDEIRQSAFYNEFLYPADNAAVCGARLPDIGDTQICLGVVRGKKQADLDLAEDAMLSLLKAVHDSLRISAAIEHRGTELLSNALSGLNLTAFIIDNSARVVGLTPGAEALAQGGNLLRLVQSRIRAADHSSDSALQAALSVACAKPNLSCRSLAARLHLRSLRGKEEWVEIAPLPSPGLSRLFGPVAVLIVKPRAVLPDAQLFRKRFNFSHSEAEIVEMLVAGKSLALIAEERAVSLGTVRAQLKSIFAKTDVNRQSELVALFHREMLRQA
jgi:DNA-binding CsgD family transcriptional regulator